MGTLPFQRLVLTRETQTLARKSRWAVWAGPVPGFIFHNLIYSVGTERAKMMTT